MDKQREEFESSPLFSMYMDKVERNGDKYKPIHYKDHDYAQIMTFSWLAWQQAQKVAMPDGFVLVEKSKISYFYQDSDEPENFCSSESDFDSLGDCIYLGEIMEINKHTQAHIQTEKLFGTWFAEIIDPSEKANFFVGSHEECLVIIEKNKAMIEAQEDST